MLTAAVSLVIVWSEVTLSITHPRLSIFAIIVYSSHAQSSYASILVSVEGFKWERKWVWLAGEGSVGVGGASGCGRKVHGRCGNGKSK